MRHKILRRPISVNYVSKRHSQEGKSEVRVQPSAFNVGSDGTVQFQLIEVIFKFEIHAMQSPLYI